MRRLRRRHAARRWRERRQSAAAARERGAVGCASPVAAAQRRLPTAAVAAVAGPLRGAARAFTPSKRWLRCRREAGEAAPRAGRMRLRGINAPRSRRGPPRLARPSGSATGPRARVCRAARHAPGEVGAPALRRRARQPRQAALSPRQWQSGAQAPPAHSSLSFTAEALLARLSAATAAAAPPPTTIKAVSVAASADTPPAVVAAAPVVVAAPVVAAAPPAAVPPAAVPCTAPAPLRPAHAPPPSKPSKAAGSGMASCFRALLSSRRVQPPPCVGRGRVRVCRRDPPCLRPSDRKLGLGRVPHRWFAGRRAVGGARPTAGALPRGCSPCGGLARRRRRAPPR